MAETLACSMFHGARAEILCRQGFEKNLQQISIRRAFFNSFPQIVHKDAERLVHVRRTDMSQRSQVPQALRPQQAKGTT